MQQCRGELLHYDGHRVIACRGIDTSGRAQMHRVAVVAETLARQFLAGRDPLREQIPERH